MTHHLVLTPDTDRLAWREELISSLKSGDEVVLRLAGQLSFTQTRQLITSLNTVAWERNCTLRYEDESEAAPPPLEIRYSRPPNITSPTVIS